MKTYDWPWTVIRSWHFVREIPEIGPAETLCGRRTFALVRWGETPSEGKSCESCLRIAARMTSSAEQV